MNKDEFLRRLEEALSGEVPASVIRDNLNYYADYLSQELGKGRTMDEIIDILIKGESFSNHPIAKSISKLKPASVKGKFITSISVSTTMGPGIKVDQNSFDI